LYASRVFHILKFLSRGSPVCGRNRSAGPDRSRQQTSGYLSAARLHAAPRLATSSVLSYVLLRPEVPKLWDAPTGGEGGGVACKRDIYFERNMDALTGTLLG
jgi:hypothetical protein